MKLKSILAILFLMAGLQTAMAQKLVLHLTGNQAVEYDISQLDSISFIEGTTETHEYVDLGLPSGTLWATCNVGANSPEEYGDYFAWGETEPKSDYSWSTYKYYKGSYGTMTKYCDNSGYGTVDNKTELEPSDDAATANWGSDWQMPSIEQFKELINSSYTTTTWTTLNGVNGRKITSKSNGNSIFLPAAACRLDTRLGNVGSFGLCWSRSLITSYNEQAYYLSFNSSVINVSSDHYSRYHGQSVRPVRVMDAQTTVAVSTIELSQTELSVKIGETTQLSATVLPDNATNKNLKWESSNVDVATVDQSGKVTSVTVGTCTITCSATDGSGVKAECKVTVPEDNSGTIDGRDYVDLGLPSGTLWATCNVGALEPEERGDYFAWGETEPKETYDWSTYKYCMGDKYTLTKYCTDSHDGTVDNKTELEPSDDAATANWGNEWQMPSPEQFDELINSSYTTTTWTTMNGVYGRKITSKSNGNSIFLPAAGRKQDTRTELYGSDGNYMSSRLSGSENEYAQGLYFFERSISVGGGQNRDWGRSVRPVHVKESIVTIL